jgi:hypothetical protein
VYEWSVAAVIDPQQRDRDLVSVGALERARPPEPPRRAAASTPDALARQGVWYDAIAQLSEAIAARPRDASLRARRAALLDQVGLAHAASYDRERGHDG